MTTGKRDEVIERLKKYYKPDEVIGLIIWSPQDVLWRYNDLYAGEVPFPMSEYDASVILESTIQNHDAASGICWDTFDYYIEEWEKEQYNA